MKKVNLVKLMMVTVFIVVSSQITMAAEESVINLIPNSGFEEKGEGGLPRGWQVVPAYAGKGEAIMDDKTAHSGKSSLKLAPNRKNTSDAFGTVILLDPALLQGKEVTISGYAKSEGLGDKIAALLFKTDKDNWIVLPKSEGDNFLPFSKTLSIAGSIPEANLLYLVQGTKGAVWLDDLKISVAGSQAKLTMGETATLQGNDDKFVNKINTPGWQDSAFITPDGKELYFAYLPYVEKDFMDIRLDKVAEKDVKNRGPIRPGNHGTLNFETYRVVRNQDGTWGKPVSLNINSTYSLYSAKTSFDGQELYYSIRDYAGNYGGDDIYVSKKLADGTWSKPENLGPKINTKYREDTPCLSADGQTMYFARNKGETYGWEIMVSRRVNGKWSEAEKLGPPINEPNPETSANYQPFITADGKELYFTRIVYLYKSEKQPDGTWGKPTKVFNRIAGHASVTADNRYLYFITAEGKESEKRHHFTIWYSERQPNGQWGNPKPVD